MTRPPGPHPDLPRPVSPTLEIRSGDTRAVIAARGAEPVAWSVGATDLLWDGDETWWPKSAPVLFPVCCQTRFGTVRVGGVSYPMPPHGFAPTSAYAVDEHGVDFLRMVLADSPATRAAYPFTFRLTAEYRVAAGSFSALFEVTNTSRATMPYSIGFHPGFNWPFAGGEKHAHAIVFESEEDPLIPADHPEGLIVRERRHAPLEGRRLSLADGVIAGKPLCFFNAQSRRVRFENDRGGAVVIEAENFPHWAIWARAGAPFLSVESWTGYSDPADFDGELADKPSMRFLAPGTVARHAVTLRYEPA